MFSVSPPPGYVFAASAASVPVLQFAMSPDGRHLVYVAGRPQEKPTIWLRALAAAEARQLPDTDDAEVPFWSPDSRIIAFFAEGLMKKREITGTAPTQVIGKATVDMRGATWSDTGTIVYAPAGNIGLFQISGAGPGRMDVHDSAGPILGARWPEFVPADPRFLFVARDSDAARRGIYLGTLGEPTARRVMDGDFGAQYASGYLLTLNDTTLVAQRFDLDAARVTGTLEMVAQPVAGATNAHRAFSASRTGVLAYSNGILPPAELHWIDRTGRSVGKIADAGSYIDFQLSPDNTRLALSRTAEKSQAPDVWVVDLVRGTESRITSDPLTESAPQWSPDGAQLVFRSNRASANLQLFRTRSSAGETPGMIWNAEQQQRAHGGQPSNILATDWSPDGRFIIYHATTSDGGYDLWALPLDPEPQPIAVGRGRFNEIQGEVSSDGRWIAYASDESGRYEIYVQRFPEVSGAAKTTVSTGGGSQPRWRGNGRELFYLRPDGMVMAAAVETGNTFTPGAVTPLFKMPLPAMTNAFRMDYVVSSDGQRFIMKVPIESAPPSITVVLNWPALLGR